MSGYYYMNNENKPAYQFLKIPIGGGLFPNKLVHPVCKNFFKWATGSEGENQSLRCRRADNHHS